MKPGDVVQLKSGGPKMTISHLNAGGQWFCVWFEGPIRRENAFPEVALQPADAPTSRVSLI